MDPALFPPRPSAATPLVSALQAKLVSQIDNGAPYDEMYVTVVEMGEESSQQDIVKVDDMIAALRSDEGNQMMKLLHTIPRPVLRSIVMRMVAYEFWERDSENHTLLYDKQGPGAYIVTLSIANRRGSAWTILENREIISLLEHYAKAVETFEAAGDNYTHGSQLDDAEVRHMEVARRIDEMYEKPNTSSAIANDSQGDVESVSQASTRPSWWEQPRFASSGRGNKSGSIRHLIRMLEKRNIAGLDENEPSKQSVCMVGNSDDVERRTQSHRLITNLRGTPHCWGLLVSCLRYAGLEPEETIIPILVTVLAGSLISVGGLNVKQAGTKSEKNPPSAKIFERCRIHVWGAKPWYYENLSHTNPSLKRLIDCERELSKRDPAILKQEIAEAKQLEAELNEKLEKIDAIERRQAEDERKIDEAEDIVRFLRDNPVVLKALQFWKGAEEDGKKQEVGEEIDGDMDGDGDGDEK
ncbi:uncharacterized protein F4812DRAFT_469725 [Daldinia caldariorum]|uniref:uncharacterized protein n=1 Tax=Daldinia caldariorum TaxID=326644 RepID=UPI0020078E44|nr:uncharacterized protein F4812DRAFT_469725 [Daldinia caldariorum]KAI1469600.1 hypothetical protein F4812DRAFT_469725 [Daldinia caldariorum]